MQLRCGTSGFSYKEWKGPFYPAGIAAADMLAHYASRLPTVEINNTFYRLPDPALLARWREQVPESFRFAVKTSRRITHVKRLKDCEEEADRFFGAVAALGDRLGAVLVQLPPQFRVDAMRLEQFLEHVPLTVPAAFEFRHASWLDPAVLALLEARGAAWVVVDEAGAPAPEALRRTAAWAYVRLRAPAYSSEALRSWYRACEPFEQAFVFFKHEDEALGPAFAERMQRLAAA
jgi:uncharacterized protein YecE (DUF72 family)